MPGPSDLARPALATVALAPAAITTSADVTTTVSTAVTARMGDLLRSDGSSPTGSTSRASPVLRRVRLEPALDRGARLVHRRLGRCALVTQGSPQVDVGERPYGRDRGPVRAQRT